MKKTINLNLATTYVPNWGGWEVVRELIANAYDAGNTVVKRLDDNTLLITSDGDPDVAQLLVMGHGTKANDGKSIGQFGEGLKLAALTASRMKWKLIIDTGRQSVTFKFKKANGLDVETLHAVVDDGHATPGKVIVTLVGRDGEIKEITESGKIMKNDKLGKIVREAPGLEPIVVWHSGLFVARLPDLSLFNWNVQHLELNRDRSVPNTWHLRIAIGTQVLRELRHDEDGSFADALVLEPKCFELVCLNSLYVEVAIKEKIERAIRKRHGDKVCFSSGDTTKDRLAASLGYTVLNADEAMIGCTSDIKRANECLTAFDGLTQVTPAEGTITTTVSEFNQLVDLLEIPARLVFFHDDGRTEGLAKWAGNKMVEVWLNEKLLLPGSRQARLRTICHELGHLHAKATDGSIEFEHGLHTIAGKLADAWLKK